MFLGIDYRDASLIALYFVVPGITIPKMRYQSDNIIIYNFFVKKAEENMFKMFVRIFW